MVATTRSLLPKRLWLAGGAMLLLGAVAVSGGADWAGVLIESLRDRKSAPYAPPRAEGKRSGIAPADEAPWLPDDAEVVGVQRAGKARAYLMWAFFNPKDHVYHDVIGGESIAVAHCPMNGCSRVYKTERDGQHLDILTGDRMDERTYILSNGKKYWQANGMPVDSASGEAPLQQFECEVTTWGEWRKAHPDTDIYLGKE